MERTDAPRPLRRRVLLLMEDDAFAEMLRETLTEAGHSVEVDLRSDLPAMLARGPFDAAVVDLDTRARDGGSLVDEIRERAPATTVIALLPCGGSRGAGEGAAAGCHVALEKPARLGALLAAVAGRR
jgi:DNA-binding response OmpR family regulator